MYSPRKASLIAGAASAVLMLSVKIRDLSLAYSSVDGSADSLSPWHVLILWAVVLVTSLITGLFIAASVRIGLFSSKSHGLSPRSTVVMSVIITAMVAVLTLTPVSAQAIVVSMAPSLLDDPRYAALAIRYGASIAIQLFAFGAVAFVIGRFSGTRASVA
jgi:hypothetical protein